MKQKNKTEIRARHQLASVAVRCGLQLTNFQKKIKMFQPCEVRLIN